METRKITIKQAKQMDLVDYLASLGHYPDPKKTRNQDYWYLSPLRTEKTPSFKVNRKLNVWYDHALGKGGTIIDFGILFYRCTIPELLEKLQASFSFHPPLVPLAGQQEAAGERKIKFLSSHLISSPALLRYLEQRCIPDQIADVWCREVRYELNGKRFYALGFKNDAGGYELRNPGFKGCISPKEVTFIDQGADNVTVFEGFFDFLSYLTIYSNQPPPTNFLILNSLAFFEKSRPIMEKHGNIHLYLDRDTAGTQCTEQSIKSSDQYKDCSFQYRDCKDLNQWLVKNFIHVKREIQSLNKTKEIMQDINNRQVSRDWKRGRQI